MQNTLVVSSNLLSKNTKRLDAQSYASDEVVLVRTSMQKKCSLVSSLSMIHKVVNRDKRIYVNDKSRGIPYLSNTDMINIAMDSVPYMSKKFLSSIDSQQIHIGDILVSAVGTIGMVSYVRKDMDGMVISGNILRFSPYKLNGYIYVFLKSKYGKAIIKNLSSGSVQEFITPSKLSKIPIPILSKGVMETAHNLIEEASSLRTAANKLINNAKLTYENIFGFSRFFGEKSICTKPLVSTTLKERLDARFYHHPKFDIASYYKFLSKHNEFPIISDIASVYLPNRFKRVFVNASRGIPMFGITGINQIMPETEKYLSTKAVTSDLIVNEGDILTARSGTIGITEICPKYLEGKIFSEDVMRIRVDKRYKETVYLFLSTTLGKMLLNSLSFGSVIIHITPEQIGNLSLPWNQACDALSEKINEALDMRNRAYENEKTAIAIVEEELK